MNLRNEVLNHCCGIIFQKRFAQRIFISFADEYRCLPEEVTQSLRNAGHLVFFDKDSLPPARDYNKRYVRPFGGPTDLSFLRAEAR
jgi:hypothetical protein